MRLGILSATALCVAWRSPCAAFALSQNSALHVSPSFSGLATLRSPADTTPSASASAAACLNVRGGGDNANKRSARSRSVAALASKDSDDNDKSETKNEPETKKEIRGGAQSPPPPPPLPTLSALRQFYFPCLALWIAGPLLSLVDTASVGLSAGPGEGAAQLGALGPATTFIDGATYLFAFLNVATTNLYAGALAKNNAKGKDAVDPRLAGDGVVRVATKISLICGLGLLTLLLKAGRTLLSIYIGPEPGDTTILDPASAYVNIRALSMPTALLAGVLQAALLGAKDSVTPLVATVTSTIVNVFGDALCVVKMGMGSKGAAIATLCAQLAGTAAMLRPAKRELLAPADIRPEERAKAGTTKVSSVSFLYFAAPVLTLILGKLAAFGIMTHVAASIPGEATLAAHQIILSLFFFISPFLEVISQTAQAFLPTYFTEMTDSRYRESADALSGRMLKIGLAVGAVVTSVAASIPRFFPGILTNDVAVQTAVRPLALPLMLGGLLTAPVAVSEGILLARRELGFLAGVYVLSTALFPSIVFKVKQAQGPVVHVWACFAGFQLFRALMFTGRIWLPKLWMKLFGSAEGKEA